MRKILKLIKDNFKEKKYGMIFFGKPKKSCDFWQYQRIAFACFSFVPSKRLVKDFPLFLPFLSLEPILSDDVSKGPLRVGVDFDCLRVWNSLAEFELPIERVCVLCQQVSGYARLTIEMWQAVAMSHNRVLFIPIYSPALITSACFLLPMLLVTFYWQTNLLAIQ